jgi:hypothetical protein
MSGPEECAAASASGGYSGPLRVFTHLAAVDPAPTCAFTWGQAGDNRVNLGTTAESLRTTL